MSSADSVATRLFNAHAAVLEVSLAKSEHAHSYQGWESRLSSGDNGAEDSYKNRLTFFVIVRTLMSITRIGCKGQLGSKYDILGSEPLALCPQP